MSIFFLRDSTDRDMQFVNKLTKSTMREYVDATWRDLVDRGDYYHQNEFKIAPTKIIQSGGQNIGRITVVYFDTRMVLENIHIIKSFQGKGVGKEVISGIIKDAKSKQVPLELMVLKVNPAKNLYLRLGFKVYREDVHRFYMRLEIE